MEKRIIIRNEVEEDYQIVEEITRNAFWNLHVPGCDEHYLVNIMREHEDFIPELDFVIELNYQVIGNIMYTKSKLIDENQEEKMILTFGPISISPEFQRLGYGKQLIEHSFKKAIELGYEVIVIFGNPDNYVSRGFLSCKKKNICMEDGSYPSAMLVKELLPGSLDGRKWFFHESDVYEIDAKEAEMFDHKFVAKEKKYLPCQEIFYINSHSTIQ